MKRWMFTLACALACSAPPAFAAASEPGETSQVWVNFGGFSRHLTRARDYNETNYGLGVEYRTHPTVSYMAGAYYNSVRHTTYYGAINWQPLIVGAWKLGASAGILNGYPSRARGGAFFAALPLATYEGTRFGVNVGLIPSVGQVDGSVVVQFKLRVF
ncbi:MAG: hypothetical protein U1D29_00450 [Burkholderiales bacterium]|nr:hypothetical protein [Burkholderiales bacterium]